MKLVLDEPETGGLRAALAAWPRQVTSVVGEVEVLRTAARGGTTAAAILQPLTLIELDGPIRRLAAGAGSPSLRSLDAIHLATAVSLGDDIGAFCCYDRRLAADAKSAGLRVVQPGLD